MNFLKDLLKSNRMLYKIYCYVGSFILKVLGIFIKTDENLILFVVYGGQRYDDSPRFMYEYMKSHEKYSNYKYVWAFIDPEQHTQVKDKKVCINSLEYFIVALRAKYWLTNSSATRGLNFKKKTTVNIFTQHGMTGIKTLVLGEKNKSFRLCYNEKFDYIVIEGKKEISLLNEAWHTTGDEFLSVGLPRNDELVNADNNHILELKKKLGIPSDKKVILYAPTFREYKRNSKLETYLAPPFDFDKWYEKLGDEYVLLLTAHYEVAKLMDVPDDHPFVINAFKYPYINDLILVSDMLISDYSSIIFDYSIIGKPIISYAYDYDVYQQHRGVYPGYENIFSHGIFRTEDEVIKHIQTMDYDQECLFTKKNIRDEYIINYGNATELAVKKIFG